MRPRLRGVGQPPVRGFLALSAVLHALVLYLLPAAVIERAVRRGNPERHAATGEVVALGHALRVVELPAVAPRQPPPVAEVLPEVTLAPRPTAAEPQPATTGPPSAPAAPAPGPSGDPVESDAPDEKGIVVPPRLIKVVVPEAPDVRGGRRVTEVPLLVLVTSSGEIAAVKVARPTGCRPCEAEAVRAARRLRFAPATRDGQPIDAWYPFAFRFGR